MECSHSGLANDCVSANAWFAGYSTPGVRLDNSYIAFPKKGGSLP